MKTEKTAIEEARDAVNASDPYERKQQTFPVLSTDQVNRMSTYGVVENIPNGTWLFERGQRGVDFFLVVEGSVEIVDKTPQGEDTVIKGARCGLRGTKGSNPGNRKVVAQSVE